MTVYVDDMRARFGRMVMCHMIADTFAELHAMADRIGVARRWFQTDASWPHYDIALSKRALAVAAGAKEITWRECGMKCHEWRKALVHADDTTKVAWRFEVDRHARGGTGASEASIEAGERRA